MTAREPDSLRDDPAREKASAPLREKGVFAVGAALAVLCAVAVIVRAKIVYFTVGQENAGSEIDNLGLVIQLSAMVVGVIAIHLASSRRAAMNVLIAEGIVCMACHGWHAAIYAGGVVLWYGLCSWPPLPRMLRVVLGLGVLVGMNALGFLGEELRAPAYLFSLIFTLRMIMFAWDRWQNDFEPAAFRDYVIYMAPAPLVVMPPYFLIIPVFSGFNDRFEHGLTRAKVRRIVRHLGWAALFGGMRAAVDPTGIDHNLFGHLVAGVMVAGAYAHGYIALLLVHGIDERLPLVRPLLATRFVDYWSRYQVHQKDAQMFLFFTPALLKLRRKNRYFAIAMATTWTMLVGNTFLHVATRYCFMPGLYERVRWLMVINIVMAAALAVEMCIDEYRRRARKPSSKPTRPVIAARWAITMCLAAIAAT